jgi:hypothetical protein
MAFFSTKFDFNDVIGHEHWAKCSAALTSSLKEQWQFCGEEMGELDARNDLIVFTRQINGAIPCTA